MDIFTIKKIVLEFLFIDLIRGFVVEIRQNAHGAGASAAPLINPFGVR